MEKSNQAFEITVKETEEQEKEDNNVYVFKHVDNIVGEFTTEELNGELKGIIITTTGLSNINISFEKYPSIDILKILNFSGQMYIPVKSFSYSRELEIFNFAPETYLLKNDKLKIKIESQKGTELIFDFRLED